MIVNQYKYSQMVIKEHNFLVPLDYDNEKDKDRLYEKRQA